MLGFLERALTPSGSRYKATEHELHRKPILYVFGSEYGSAFALANKRAQAACGAFLEHTHTEPLCPYPLDLTLQRLGEAIGKPSLG